MSEEGDVSNFDETTEDDLSDSDGDSEDGVTPVELPLSPGGGARTEPFEVVLKGASPWGFVLECGAESQSALRISQIEEDSKAGLSELRVGDYIISVNDVRCITESEANQLIQSAFRTLALSVWRSTAEPATSPVRTASFLQKARELQELARQRASGSGVQDDSAVFTQSKSSSFRMKPRQRRIESFHGRRPGSSSQAASSSSSSSASSSHYQRRFASPGGENSDAGFSPTPRSPDGSTNAKLGLRGWATEQDLSSAAVRPSSLSGHVTSRHMSSGPLSPAKSSPSLNQENIPPAAPRSYVPFQPQSMMTAKSSPDIPDNFANPKLTSPQSPHSPSWYQHRLPNRPTFDFSSVPSSSSHRWPSSPRESYSGYSTTSSGSYTQAPSSYDDTTRTTGINPSKNYDRRSLPPHLMTTQHRQNHASEFDGGKPEEIKQLHSMPTTKEEDENESDMPNITHKPFDEKDYRPMYSPPAPPVRDISSLKYVGFSQNHEKYPSWPVNSPLTSHDPVGPSIDPQGPVEVYPLQQETGPEKNSPLEERKSLDEKQTRNQSDPGFLPKGMKKSFYTTRKPRYEAKERNYENIKSEEERFEEFYNTSKPGYPPPRFDPDGHNLGDKEYNIPSPPERDVPNFDQKTLVEKIAAVISPSPHQEKYFHLYNMEHHGPPSDSLRKMDSATSPLTGPSYPDSLKLQTGSPQFTTYPGTGKVDSSTSPIQSPSDVKGFPTFRVPSSSAKIGESYQSPTDRSRGLIIRQTPYYNTSTQTDESPYSVQTKVKSMLDDHSSYREKASQAKMSRSSLSSENSDSNFRHSGDEDHTKPLSKSDFSGHSRLDSSKLNSGRGNQNLGNDKKDQMAQFSDASNAAPMLRKLSEEFYRNHAYGSHLDKRMSSASNYDDLKSVRSESLYGSTLSTAESYSSVVIHPHETSTMPFSRDDYGSQKSLSTPRPDGIHLEGPPVSSVSSIDLRHVLKNSHTDPSSFIHKPTGSLSSVPSRSLYDTKYMSDSGLVSGSYTKSRDYSQSMQNLPTKKPSPLTELTQSRAFNYSSESSTGGSSSARTSMEARSSGGGSRYGSDSSASGRNSDPPRDLDSVFYDKTSPVPADLKKGSNVLSDSQGFSNENQSVSSVGIGRKESMKLAYGTYDEHERNYSIPYQHLRNTSELTSASPKEMAASPHARSASYSDYMPMHGGHVQSPLGLIEEEAEGRWADAVKKSTVLGEEQNDYMNVEFKGQGEETPRTNTDKPEPRLYMDRLMSGTSFPLKRTTSEQIRPISDHVGKKQSELTEVGKSSDPTTGVITNHPRSESDLKKLQQKAVLDFVERKTKPSSSSGSDGASSDTLEPPSEHEKQSSTEMASSIIEKFPRKYNFTKAQRTESLKRTRSMSSNSSRDSSDYVDMRRPDRIYAQTEWSRLRSQSRDGDITPRPLSIGSDASGHDTYAICQLSPLATPEGETNHIRSASDLGTASQSSASSSSATTVSTPDPTQTGPPASNSTMVTSPIYQNMGGPRRPPPPVPGLPDDDKPPALPPRARPFLSTKSESALLRKPLQQQNEDSQPGDTKPETRVHGALWENSPREDAYAEQLRQQARRYSQQQLQPTKMSVVSTSLASTQVSKSYKREQAQPFEATPPQSTSSPTPPDLNQVSRSPVEQSRNSTPTPPPLPTPLKNGEKEIRQDLNDTADFPPPPLELMEPPPPPPPGEELPPDRCADDSYGQYKTKTTREVGNYKRAQSDSNVLRAFTGGKFTSPLENNNYKNMSENIPTKPPRKKLEQSPALVQENNTDERRSDNFNTSNSSNHGAISSSIPAFQASHSVSVSVQKSVAQPLHTSPLPPKGSPSDTFIKSVTPMPFRSAEHSEDKPKASIRDKISTFEQHNSPGQHRAQLPKIGGSSVGNIKQSFENALKSHDQQHSSREGTPRRTSESGNEKTGNVLRISNSFRDRFRPNVQKREESPQTEQGHLSKSYHSSPRIDESVQSLKSEEKLPDSQQKSESDSYKRSSLKRSHERSRRSSGGSSNSSQDQSYRNQTPKSQSIDSPVSRYSDNSSQQEQTRLNGAHVQEQTATKRNLQDQSRTQGARYTDHVQDFVEKRTSDSNLQDLGRSSTSSLQDQSRTSRTNLQQDHSRHDSASSLQDYSRNNSRSSLHDQTRLSGSNLQDPSRLSGSRLHDHSRTSGSSLQDQSGHHPRYYDSSSQLEPGKVGSRETTPRGQYEQARDQRYRDRPHKLSDERQFRSLQDGSQQTPPSRHSDFSTSDYRKRLPSGEVNTSRHDIPPSLPQRTPPPPPSESTPPSSQTQSYYNQQRYKNDNLQQYRPSLNPPDSVETPRSLEGNSVHSRPSSGNISAKENISKSGVPMISHNRQPSAEELECDKEAVKLAQVLPEEEKKLSQVLQDNTNRMQYMSGLFPEPNSFRKSPKASPSSSTTQSKDENEQSKKATGDGEEKSETSPLPANYYVSPPKAMIELELRRCEDASQELTKDIADDQMLAEKKEELLERMNKKVDILKEEKADLMKEIDDNEKIGDQVSRLVDQKCRNQQEKDKFKSYIEDIEKIVRLLLKLSGLLARAENAVQSLDQNANEKIKKMTYDKRERVKRQHEEARELKEDIDKRSVQVMNILQQYLQESELEDYKYYIQMKSKMTIQMQELDDKITLGNEQIQELQRSIPNKRRH